MSYIRDFGRWIRTHNNPDTYVLTESLKSLIGERHIDRKDIGFDHFERRFIVK